MPFIDYSTPPTDPKYNCIIWNLCVCVCLCVYDCLCLCVSVYLRTSYLRPSTCPKVPPSSPEQRRERSAPQPGRRWYYRMWEKIHWTLKPILIQNSSIHSAPNWPQNSSGCHECCEVCVHAAVNGLFKLPAVKMTVNVHIQIVRLVGADSDLSDVKSDWNTIFFTKHLLLLHSFFLPYYFYLYW